MCSIFHKNKERSATCNAQVQYKNSGILGHKLKKEKEKQLSRGRSRNHPLREGIVMLLCKKIVRMLCPSITGRRF